MRMQAVQSALAIRRQRCRREEQKRARARRQSTQSGGSIGLLGSQYSLRSPRGSIVSMDGRTKCVQKRQPNLLSTRVMGTVTMFHVGIVFVILGLMLIISSLIPGYSTRDWQELLGTGCFLVFLGIVLTIINRIVSRKEEEKFEHYITRRLARSKSGSKFAHRDAEAGLDLGLPSSHLASPPSSLKSPAHHKHHNGHSNPSLAKTPPESLTPTPGTPHSAMDLPLEKIMEEGESQMETLTLRSDSQDQEQSQMDVEELREQDETATVLDADLADLDEEKCVDTNDIKVTSPLIMIGAMPAVAVRHERRRHELHRQKQNRPTRLALKSSDSKTWSNSPSLSSIATSATSRTPNTPMSLIPTISRGSMPSSVSRTTLASGNPVPLTEEEMASDYCCYGKFPLLHFLVISLLIGITLVIVGLVQFKPGAESSAKKYFFLGSGASCLIFGFILMIVRCCLLCRYRRNLARAEGSASFSELNSVASKLDLPVSTPLSEIGTLPNSRTSSSMSLSDIRLATSSRSLPRRHMYVNKACGPSKPSGYRLSSPSDSMALLEEMAERF